MKFLFRLAYLWTLSLASDASLAAESPLADAAAVWHFGDTGTPPQLRPLTLRGDVQIGVALQGDDRAASLARGGDGQAVLFNGGHLEIGGPPFAPPGAEFTLVLRVRDPEGAWNAPLFGSYGGDGAVSLYLRGVDGATLPRHDRNFVDARMSTPADWMFGWPDGPRAISGSRGVIECVWGATKLELTPERCKMLPKKDAGEEVSPLTSDARNAVLRVMFPLEATGPGDWHDIVVRGTGPKLQLWIDGVLVDKEYPIGTMRPAAAPWLFGAATLADGSLQAGFRGLMDHAALWHRALSDAEIVELSGGAAVVNERELAILGPLKAQMQYYRPRGHNSKAGDCFPLFHDGTYHLFYLVLRRNMHSKWDGGHGALEIFHASTRDLVHWKHHPVAAPISEQWEAWNGTGNTVFHDGRFWMFYPTPDYDGDRGGIQLATSTDGELFTKDPKHPFLPGGDCEVFADPDPRKQTVHLVKYGRSIGSGLPELSDKTLIAWVSAADLDQRGGGVLTVEGVGEQTGQFDSVVLGEIAPRRWMAGSDNLRRTQGDQSKIAEETAKPDEYVQVAAVYEGNTVALYRNGSCYARYEVEHPLHFKAGAQVLLGLRHLDRSDDPSAHFRGTIADARVYGTAITEAQLADLRCHESSGPKPLVWFDFQSGGTVDRAGTLPDGQLEGDAVIRNGALVLNGRRSRLVAGGQKITLAHLVSEDCRTWRELPEPFIVTDEAIRPQMCPHWFRWNDWYYFLGGEGGIFRSRNPYGPWTRQLSGKLDNLYVPKTAAFTGNRRILAGFLWDGGWGGDLVMRDLVQHEDGTLGTRFVPEMIPASGDPIRLTGDAMPVRLDAKSGRQQVVFDGVPRDARITLTLESQGAKAFGVRLRTSDGEHDGTILTFVPQDGRALYTAATHSGSGGEQQGGPAIGGLGGLDGSLRLDIICHHDIVDMEVEGRHTLVNRYWNPRGDRFGVWAENGAITVRDLVIRPLNTPKEAR